MAVTRPTTFLLVRHGESVWNALRLVQGQSPAAGSLTATGRAHAEAAAAFITALGCRPDALLSSDLARARDTARILGPRLGLPVRYDPRLREQHLGALEGSSLDGHAGGRAVAGLVEELWRRPSRAAPGGESVARMQARVVAVLAGIALLWPGGRVVAVTHGGPIRAALAAADADGEARLQRRDGVPNGSVHTLTLVPGAAPAWLLPESA